MADNLFVKNMKETYKKVEKINRKKFLNARYNRGTSVTIKIPRYPGDKGENGSGA